jgi:hypothetical protein
MVLGAVLSSVVKTCKELAQPAVRALQSLSMPAATATTAAVNNPVVNGAMRAVQKYGAAGLQNGFRNGSNLVAATGAVGYNAILPPGGGGPVLSGTGQVLG